MVVLLRLLGFFIILEKWRLLRESLIEYYIYVFFLFVYCMEIVLIILVKVRKNIYLIMLNDDNKIDDLMLI